MKKGSTPGMDGHWYGETIEEHISDCSSHPEDQNLGTAQEHAAIAALRAKLRLIAPFAPNPCRIAERFVTSSEIAP